MTVADLYLTLAIVFVCGIAGAYVYKYHCDNEERIESIEQTMAILWRRLPELPASDTDTLRRVTKRVKVESA